MPETTRLKKTIDAWWTEIETFITTRVTNAKTEVRERDDQEHQTHRPWVPLARQLQMPDHALQRRPDGSVTTRPTRSITRKVEDPVYPTSHFTVLRGALVGAAQSVWLLSPDDALERQQRALRVIDEWYRRRASTTTQSIRRVSPTRTEPNFVIRPGTSRNDVVRRVTCGTALTRSRLTRCLISRSHHLG